MNDKNNMDNNISDKGLNNDKDNGMLLPNHKFFEDCKNDDEFLNNKVQASRNPEDKMNEENIIERSIESANKMSKYNDDENYDNKDEEQFISTFPNSPSTGLMP